MSSYLITGSSRGLGLNLVSLLASLPESEVSTIFATARSNNSGELKRLIEENSSRVIFVPLDVANEQSIDEAKKEVERYLDGKGLDILINNAGVMPITQGGVEKMYVHSVSVLACLNYPQN
jgi:NAD(P)-dependent dehydrogenase (short-subunit alcohol dehydrogenase family)